MSDCSFFRVTWNVIKIRTIIDILNICDFISRIVVFEHPVWSSSNSCNFYSSCPFATNKDTKRKFSFQRMTPDLFECASGRSSCGKWWTSFWTEMLLVSVRRLKTRYIEKPAVFDFPIVLSSFPHDDQPWTSWKPIGWLKEILTRHVSKTKVKKLSKPAQSTLHRIALGLIILHVCWWQNRASVSPPINGCYFTWSLFW